MEEAKESVRDMKDPYGNDPARHSALHINSVKPFNAEPPSSLLADSFVTPVYVYVYTAAKFHFIKLNALIFFI